MLVERLAHEAPGSRTEPMSGIGSKGQANIGLCSNVLGRAPVVCGCQEQCNVKDAPENFPNVSHGRC
jgi:hypothetical protein